MEELKNKVALVTGGSRGIGAAIALELARTGAKVAFTYHQDEEAAKHQLELLQTLNKTTMAIRADLTQPSQITELIQQVEKELGAVEILISNAAIGERRDLAQISLEDWELTMQTNVRPAFLLAQRVVPAMQKQGWGRIVIMSSVAAFTGGLVGPHYATSKAALLGLMHSLASLLAPTGITVNAVAPAMIAQTGTLPGTLDQLEAMAARLPVRRLGLPQEVAQAVLGLITNGFITGQTLVIDGGIYPH